ncbi:MAG: type II secretion system F family protein [Phycisphaerae bacterium]|jgi:type II secretory pathway component PulF
MPAFMYRAADLTGRVTEGVLEEESEAVALRRLEQQSLTPLTLRRAKDKRAAAAGRAATSRIRLRLSQLLEFTRQLKVMLKSGITLLDALGILRAASGPGAYRRLLDSLAADIQRGATLSEALAAHPKTFDAFYIGTIRAGEAVGVHPEAMDELIRHFERRAALRRELINALTYPAIVIMTLIGACVTMLIFVVPQFTSLFANMGERLPLPTRILLAASDFTTQHGVFLGVGAGVLLAVIVATRRSSTTKTLLARLLARVPMIGRIVYLSTVIQFCRMIALLEGAGLPLLETLRIVEDALLPGRVQRLATQIRRNVAAGSSISSTVTGSHVLPKLVEHMVTVGEATGSIDEMLSACATHLEEEMRVRIKILTTALEPALVLVVSGFVLLVALAIFLPVWEMNSMYLKS